MIKIKLSIDPTQPNQVDAFNNLMVAIGQPKVYPTKMMFAPGANGLSNVALTEITNKGVEPLANKLSDDEQKIKTFVSDEPEAETPLNLFAEETVTKPKKATKPTFVPKEETKEDGGMNEALLQDQKEAEGNATLEQIRDILGKKVTDHRESIKSKLTELGAKNVSVLNPEHYTAFHNFLTEL